MPTHEETTAFQRDRARLTEEQAERLKARLADFIADLKEMEASRRSWFRPGLRVKKLSGRPDVYEMSWAADGRATFAMGNPIVAGKLHIVWLRGRQPRHPPATRSCSQFARTVVASASPWRAGGFGGVADVGEERLDLG